MRHALAKKSAFSQQQPQPTTSRHPSRLSKTQSKSHPLVHNERLQTEIVNRFKHYKQVSILKGMLLLDKKQVRQAHAKQREEVLGYSDLLAALNEHLFRDRSRLDLDQFKQYFFEELVSENPAQLETAFSLFENLAGKKGQGGGLKDQTPSNDKKQSPKSPLTSSVQVKKGLSPFLQDKNSF